jgi:hypothetical protein
MTSPRVIGGTDRRRAPRNNARPNGSIAALDRVGGAGRAARGMKHESIAAIVNSKANSARALDGYEWSVD